MIYTEYELFLENQKKEWLSKTTNKGKFDEANSRYHPELWFAKAIKNSRYAITTHSSTFTHSDAKSTAILFSKPKSINGYLTSNNVNLHQLFDVFGNAATDTIVKETYIFLTRKLSDGCTVWQCFENKTDSVKIFIEKLNQDFDQSYSSLKNIFSNSDNIKTTGLLKQVYFPISSNNSYYLLSLVTSSPLITEILKRVDFIRFDESSKEAKEHRKKQQYHETGYNDLLNITQVGFGGSKPQNVSVLNSQNSGRAYLLASTPPKLEKRSIRLPKTDFFAQCLRRKNFQDSFIQLHRLMKPAHKNDDVRQGIKNIIHFIIDRILLEAFKIREHYDSDWSSQDYYEYLPKLQRIWLDNAYQNDRDVEWREELSIEVARWILHCYEKTIHDAFILGDGELSEVKKMVTEAINKDKEYF